MADNKNVVRLLVLEQSSHEAEVLGSAMRNAGYAVRPKHIEDAAGLQQALHDQPWDLFIATEHIGDFGAVQALESVKKAGKDVPTIVLMDSFNPAAAAEMMQAGAAACVPHDAPDYLFCIIAKELDNLHERRAHRQCRNLCTESEKRNRSLLDSSRDAIAYIHEGMHIYANQSYLDIFGYDSGEELESVPIMDMIAGESQADFKELLRTLSRGDTPAEARAFGARRNNGESFNVTMEFSPASIDGEPCTQVMIRTRADNQELVKELEQLRKQDLLTGLYNRQHFMQELTDAVARASKGGHTSTLLYIEPDNFKTIKDTLGIGGSDIVLTDMANILRKHTRDSDILARFAGTIFAAIVDDTDLAKAEKTAAALKDVVKAHIFEVEGHSVNTTCSIGVVQITETTPDAKKAIALAENACALAKEKNGDKIHVFSDADLRASQAQNQTWIERIQSALKNNEFQLVYQPVVSLHAEPSPSYEVLLRLLDKTGTVVLPGEFLPIAEQARMMPEIDRWVVKNAAKALLDQRRDGKQIRFFIKLATDSIKDPTFLPWISKLLKAARLHGASFVFEASEPTALNHLREMKAFIAGLKQLHCGFAIDHVASETTSFSYLEHLDVQFIKVDGSVIDQIAASDQKQELLKTVTELARGRNIQTIAERVQDPACLAVLWQCGVNYIQGYYLQQPQNSLNYDFAGG